MEVKLTKLGWQIVYTENKFINKNMWGKTVNNKVYSSWNEAWHYLDKCAE